MTKILQGQATQAGASATSSMQCHRVLQGQSPWTNLGLGALLKGTMMAHRLHLAVFDPPTFLLLSIPLKEPGGENCGTMVMTQGSYIAEIKPTIFQKLKINFQLNLRLRGWLKGTKVAYGSCLVGHQTSNLLINSLEF